MNDWLWIMSSEAAAIEQRNKMRFRGFDARTAQDLTRSAAEINWSLDIVTAIYEIRH
jgi:hypothetical protein